MTLKILALLCAIFSTSTFAQVTTSTDVGRIPLAHPDYQHVGGTSLHTKVATIYTLLSNHVDSRYFEFSLTNGNFLDFTHNFQTPFLDVGWTLYLRNSGTGELTIIDENSTPAISTFTIAGGSDVTDQIRVTNDTAGSQTLALVIFQGKDAISSLRGVNISSPTDNQGIFYNNSTKKWENKSLGTAANTASTGIPLTNLNDVVITAAALGDIIYFDNTNWVDTTLAALANTASIGVGITDLNDVVITAAANGDILRHNGTNWVDDTLANLANTASIGIGQTDLNDTILASLLNGDIMRYNGSNWLNAPLSSTADTASPVGVALDNLNNVTAPTPQDGQALVYNASLGRWEPGASGDASFKIQSTTSTQVVIKGGSLELKDGRQLKTYNGGGPAETNFGVDLTCTLNASPANATLFYLAINLNAIYATAAITVTETGQRVYPFVCTNLVQLTVPNGQGAEHFFAQGFANDPGGYSLIGYVRSATTGNNYNGTGSRFGDLARRSTNTPMERRDGGLTWNFLENQNFNFEQSESSETSANGAIAGWSTNTNNIATINATTPLAGGRSLVLNSTGSTQTATSPNTPVFQPAQRGKSCLARFKYIYPTGLAGDWTAKVINTQDSSDITAAQNLAVTSSTVTQTYTAAFSCVDSASVTPAIRLTSTANTGDLTVDEFYLGLDDRLGTQTDGAEVILFAEMSAAANCTMQRTSATFGVFTADADCNNTHVVFYQSIATTNTTSDLPRSPTFPTLPPGVYRVTAQFTGSTTVGTQHAFLINDGATSPTALGGVGDSGGNFMPHTLSSVFSYTTTQTNKVFEIFGQSSGTVQINNESLVGRNSSISWLIERFPNQSPRETVTPGETQGQYWDASLTTVSDILLGTATDASLTADAMNVSDGTLVPSTGSAPIGVACAGTSENSVGTLTCNALGADETVGVVVDLPRAGGYWSCPRLAERVILSTVGSSINTQFQQVITPNNDIAGTAIFSGNIHTSGHVPGNNGPQSSYILSFCEMIPISAAGKYTFRMRKRVTNVGGTITNHTMDSGANLKWTIFPVTQQFPQAIALGSIASAVGTTTANEATAGNVGEKIPTGDGSYAQVSSTASPQNLATVVLTPGDWFCYGNVYANGAAGAGAIELGWNNVSNTIPLFTTGRRARDANGYDNTSGTGSLIAPSVRINISASETWYLVTDKDGGVATLDGKAQCIRTR